jgi:putative nucleotidyltransferase with HDIG domain
MSPSTPDSAESAGMPANILLVDDDEIFRPALQKTLERLGHGVTSATNGADAWRALSAEHFDLVISDIRMPEMDGIELTRRIKESPRPVPVLLITGFSSILETKEAHSLGADAFLTKPIDRGELSNAISRCLSGGKEPAPAMLEQDDDFCRLAIDDFTSGRQILFNIFIRLGEGRYIKIANQGEDLSIERVKIFKTKGVDHLHLRREDFRTYVGFSLTLARAVRTAPKVSSGKKLNLLKHTGEVLLEQIRHDGVDKGSYDGAAVFVQSTIDVLCESPDVLKLLEVLSTHADYLYAHSVGVSLYSVMIASAADWSLPTNKFKVAVGGLLHDVGEKELARDLLSRPRKEWSVEELKLYETHPQRGVEILNKIEGVPADVISIVKEHHEDCLGQGFPQRLRRGGIQPMSKLVSVANEFCDRVIKNPNYGGLTPHQALEHMSLYCKNRIDPLYFAALMRLFNFVPAHSKAKAASWSENPW